MFSINIKVVHNKCKTQSATVAMSKATESHEFCYVVFACSKIRILKRKATVTPPPTINP